MFANGANFLTQHFDVVVGQPAIDRLHHVNHLRQKDFHRTRSALGKPAAHELVAVHDGVQAHRADTAADGIEVFLNSKPPL